MDMRENKVLRSLAGAAGYMGLLLGASGAVVLVFMIFRIENQRIVSVFSAIASVAAACLWLHRKKRDIPEGFSIRPVPVKTLFLIIGAAAFVTLAVQCLQFLFPAAMQRGFAGEVLTDNLALDIIGLIVVAPLAEEIFFRALLIPVLSNGMGKIAAVIVSSLLFAVMHDGVIWILMAFCISLFYSYVFVRTESVLSCIAAHMVSNAMAVAYHFLFT